MERLAAIRSAHPLRDGGREDKGPLLVGGSKTGVDEVGAPKKAAARDTAADRVGVWRRLTPSPSRFRSRITSLQNSARRRPLRRRLESTLLTRQAHALRAAVDKERGAGGALRRLQQHLAGGHIHVQRIVGHDGSTVARRRPPAPAEDTPPSADLKLPFCPPVEKGEAKSAKRSVRASTSFYNFTPLPGIPAR